jgi:hypothetical protein
MFYVYINVTVFLIYTALFLAAQAAKISIIFFAHIRLPLRSSKKYCAPVSAVVFSKPFSFAMKF